MFLIPLNQIESVDLVIHALRMAGGDADCSMCPVRKVCTKQCLSVADGIEQLALSNSLPHFGGRIESPDDTPPQTSGPSPAGHLRRVK